MDINGNVSTCNSTNFFIIKDNKIITSKGKYCLNGVTRENIINICKENDIPIILKDFKLKDVYQAEGSFITGTFSGVIPINQIDQYKFKPLPIITKLFNLYKEKIKKQYL